jgi:hypothetical protein
VGRESKNLSRVNVKMLWFRLTSWLMVSISTSAFVEVGLACLVEIPFPGYFGYFLHSKPLIFPFDTQLSFASPLYSFIQALFKPHL